MAASEPYATQIGAQLSPRRASHAVVRPLPLRTATEPEAFEWIWNSRSPENHIRRKSTYTFSEGPSRGAKHARHSASVSSAPRTEIDTRTSTPTATLSTVPERYEEAQAQEHSNLTNGQGVLTPPGTPAKIQDAATPGLPPNIGTELFDFSSIDYELERAPRIGQGLWSTVHLAEPVLKTPRQAGAYGLTPPTSPKQGFDAPFARLLAVKSPARPDAKAVFVQEARTLTRLQCSPSAHLHIVTFHGLDERNSSLVFEGVFGGSLEHLIGRLKMMTEVSRHLELRTLFHGLAKDMIGGLCFIHAAGVVHADIKPGNILLDITDNLNHQRPVLRARYIDFSASFVVGEGSTVNAGGTWDFLAPEQMRVQKSWNTPTFASDVWSLGITLLSIIAGGSPYTAACGSNTYMLREAIKAGDPLGFAQMDPIVHKRMAASQDFVDCCRLALQKDRDRRYTAAAWEAQLAEQ